MAPRLLQKIVDQKKKEVESLYTSTGIGFFRHQAEKATDPRRSLFSALARTGLSLIAEIKKASPSRGVLRTDFDPIKLAESFQAAGADALSILTDEPFFQGDIAFMEAIRPRVTLPILRKDFIIDPIQVYRSKAHGADAILLIQAILPAELSQHLLTLATQLGLDVLLEVHNERELETALSMSGLAIVGINNRDLDTFEVDTNNALLLARKLRQRTPALIKVVAESGYFQPDELDVLESSGIDGVLIGEGLAKNPDLIRYFSKKKAIL